MGSMNVFASGAWRKAKGAHVFADGAWRKAKAVWVFTGGAWRESSFGITPRDLIMNVEPWSRDAYRGFSSAIGRGSMQPASFDGLTITGFYAQKATPDTLHLTLSGDIPEALNITIVNAYDGQTVHTFTASGLSNGDNTIPVNGIYNTFTAALSGRWQLRLKIS